MKKVFLAVLAIITFTTVNAQKKGTKKAEVDTEKVTGSLQSEKGENYLPEQGDWAIGFNANSIFKNLARSFNGNEGSVTPEEINMKEGAFVGKLFIEDRQAYRVVLNLGFGSDAKTTPLTNAEQKVTSSAFEVQIGLGKEWRRGKTRLQGFYGVDALVGFDSGLKTKNTITTISGPVANSETITKTGSQINFGVNGFVGAEYFLLPKMSLGAQYNWGLGIGIIGKSETTTSGTGIPSTTVEGGKGTAINFGGVGTASLNLTLHF